MALSNPFRMIQEEKNLSIHSMAGLLGVSIPTLQGAFYGSIKKPTVLLNALEKLGYSRTQLQQEYETWKKSLCEEAQLTFHCPSN